MPYRHLTREQRSQLGALLRARLSQRAIASALGCSQATVCRERQRGSARTAVGYDARSGQRYRDACRLRANARFQTFQVDAALQSRVVEGFRRTLSPEQVSARLALEEGRPLVSTSTLYRWVERDRPDLRPRLRCKKGKYQRRRGTAARVAAREAQEMKRSIDTRPVAVMERAVVGDWEGDTVRGPQGETAAIATAVDRWSGLLEAAKLVRATASETRLALAARLTTHPASKRRTATFDNGSEFAESDLLERALGMPVYFAHPYHSWERGTNENTNGLLREFFPKKTSLTHVTQRQVDRAVRILNNRPRKRLGYRTPAEVFHGDALRMQM